LRRLLMDTEQLRGQVVFTFDGDAAGQKAALRAFEDDQKFAAHTFIAVSPGGMDPCELRLAEGDDAVRGLVERPVPLFEFAIRAAVASHDLDTAEGRAAALERAAPIVARIKDGAIQHEYAVRLAAMIGILDEPFVVRRVAQIRRRGAEPAARPARPQGGARPDPRDPRRQVERELLKLALQTPALVAPVLDAFGEDEFPTPAYRAVRAAVAAAGGVAYGADGAGDAWVGLVREACPDGAVRALVTELAVEPLRTRREADALYAGGFLVSLRAAAVDRRVSEVRGHLSRLGPETDPAHYTEVQRE